MIPDVVVDVGNSRIKWGRCTGGGVRQICSLPADDVAAWERQRNEWGLKDNCQWVVTGVQPARRGEMIAWLRHWGQNVLELDDWRMLPLRVPLERPDYVGMDRLFDAVAANSRRKAGVPAVVVDAGSAITVDLVDASGAFVGGAILPGLRLMAKSLHDYTALLPLIEPPRQAPAVPGKSTIAAMEAGIFWAAVGGIEALLREYRQHSDGSVDLFLTGGDGPLLKAALPDARLWPEMTLEGIRRSAEAIPT